MLDPHLRQLAAASNSRPSRGPVTQITGFMREGKGDVDVNSFDLIERSQAPLLAEAWRQLRWVLEDGCWHTGSELLAATVGAGVPAAATRALLTTAVRTGRVQVGGLGGVSGFRLAESRRFGTRAVA